MNAPTDYMHAADACVHQAMGIVAMMRAAALSAEPIDERQTADALCVVEDLLAQIETALGEMHRERCRA